MRCRTSIATTALLVLTIAGCASEDSDDPTADRTGSGSGADCRIDGAVPIGAALSLTGPAGSYGDPQRKGLELALGELNSKGGITYDLRVEDDATDPKQGITVFEKFATTDAVSVILGPTLSTGAKVADPVAQENKVPVLGISNTAAGITEIGDYVFRDSLTEDVVIPQTIEKAKSALGLKKVVVLYGNDDAFTQSGYEAFKGALDEQGVEIAKTLTFSKADTDFRALLTDAKAANADALVVSGLIDAAIPLVTQARELGIDKPIIGGNGFNNPKLMKDAGAAAEGIIVGAAWNSASKASKNAAFLEAYQAKFGVAPDQFAAQAYTGFVLVDAAVREGCSASREAIKDNLGKLKDVDTVLGTFSFDDNRDAVHPAVVQIVKDGKFAVLE
ncbi:ABC transporter substrate-binding protein [Antrihabitans sp. YC3-6]|uniref:ABC transporter substrate-binding protein n=1 Tax=Antrihabitans stalagmiti TaxID=2799499 RepID=A0A934U774_9NOCA|nr:ABC transporter substrate-binding protein [Antrihabitans stalagmiti]MBJ8342723.1 ABC transporter substrate-binding protein [Antrihabitans stalagmiti]